MHGVRWWRWSAAVVGAMALVTSATLGTQGCRAHTTGTVVVASNAPPAAEVPVLKPVSRGPLSLDLHWSHDSGCTRSFAFVEVDAGFLLEMDGDGPAALIIEHLQQDTSGPAAGSTAPGEARTIDHHSTRKRFTWTGEAAIDGERLRLELGEARCEVVEPEQAWVLMECPDPVPRLELDCRNAQLSDLPPSFHVDDGYPAGTPLLRCDVSSPDEIPFGLWVLEEPLAFSLHSGLHQTVFRGGNLIEGELVLPTEPVTVDGDPR